MNKNSNSTITKQRIAAPKLLILLSAILSLVLDAAVIAVLFRSLTSFGLIYNSTVGKAELIEEILLLSDYEYKPV